MKNKILMLSLLFISLIACSSDEKPKEQEEGQQKIPVEMQPTSDWPNLILGKWEFVEQCESNAITGAFTCRTPSIHIYDFQIDSAVITNQFINNCEMGTYNLEDDNLYFEFPCVNLSIETEVYFLDDEQLILVGDGDDSTLYRIYKRIEK